MEVEGNVLDTLRQDGIAFLDQGLTIEQTRLIRLHLRECSCYNNHVKVYSDGNPRRFEDIEDQAEVWCHDMVDVILAPHLWELALSQLPLMAEYLGVPPLIYSINAFWARPGVKVPDPAIQSWHRDNDDVRFCAMFVYGSSVLNEAHGPHRFRRGTQNSDDLSGGGAEGPETTVYGVPGTTFFANTHGMHMGGKPQNGRRLLMWARFGISDPPQSYVWDKLAPIDAKLLGDRYPTDPEVRKAVRLVAR